MSLTDDAREVVRAEFARLEPVDPELTRQLEAYAVAAVGGLGPDASADVAIAVVAGAHEVVAPPADAGPTVGELSVAELVATALGRRRTPRRTGA